MSLQFHLFPSGAPPADTDNLLISRVDGTSPSGFSNFQLTWAELKATVVGAGTPGKDGAPGWDGFDGEDAIPVPGPRGIDGSIGINGRDGNSIVGADGQDGEDGFGIPGPRGADGVQTTNTTITFITLDGEEGPEGLAFPGPQGPQGVPGAGGGGELQLDKHVLTTNFTITAGWAAYITRYLELAAGVVLEIGADGDMEIG